MSFPVPGAGTFGCFFCCTELRAKQLKDCDFSILNYT